jgi:hypothetical protein
MELLTPDPWEQAEQAENAAHAVKEFEDKRQSLAMFLLALATGHTWDDVDEDFHENYTKDADDILRSQPHLLSLPTREHHGLWDRPSFELTIQPDNTELEVKLTAEQIQTIAAHLAGNWSAAQLVIHEHTDRYVELYLDPIAPATVHVRYGIDREGVVISSEQATPVDDDYEWEAL